MPAADPFPVLCLLQSHLESRAAAGEKRLWLTAEAREALREIVRMKPRPWTAEQVAAAAAVTEAVEAGSGLPDAVSAGLGSGDIGTAGEPAESTISTIYDLAATAESAAPVLAERAAEAHGSGNDDEEEEEWGAEGLTAEEELPVPAVSGPVEPEVLLSKAERLAALRARAEEGKQARALGTLRDKMVFAVGSEEAEIVFVGEAPGAEEERQGEPFVGPAGQLLTRIIQAMGLKREEVYISNICKYRPALEGQQGSRNRQPTPLEMASCLDFVREEIRIIRPKVIVTLGATAASGLLGIQSGVMSARGRFYEFEGIPAMVTLHPSYLLHREKDGPESANAEKRKVWEDMMQVMERAGLTVSEKQRRYFLPR